MLVARVIQHTNKNERLVYAVILTTMPEATNAH